MLIDQEIEHYHAGKVSDFSILQLIQQIKVMAEHGTSREQIHMMKLCIRIGFTSIKDIQDQSRVFTFTLNIHQEIFTLMYQPITLSQHNFMFNLVKINGMVDGMVSLNLGISILVMEHTRLQIMEWMNQINYHMDLAEESFQSQRIGNKRTYSKIIGDPLNNHQERRSK